LERPPADRPAFVEGEAAGDAELACEVLRLLAADGMAEGLSRDFVHASIASEARTAEGTPQRIGPYRIERELGRGGMGTVYLASRDGDYDRTVAIKVLRRGMDTEDIVRRFTTERQILADLDHPHIARLFDGGTTPDGLPYFVMEAIEGEPIDRYCAARRLTVTERLRLFGAVCAAVSYAHQNLVVHRDLKPSNILVAADGSPKLLDFGIAKLLGPEGGPVDATAAGLLPLTPGYASPEQMRGEGVGTASDVYSLGVVLAELLTGRKAGEPPTAALKGDLAAVVGKALRDEPQERYGSVEQLAEDVRRHLAALPVTARRGTFTYRAGKFVQRNRVALVVGAALSSVVLAFAGTALVQSRRAALERDKAERSLEFLVELFEVSQPEQALGREVSAREVLDRGAERVSRELDGRPEVQATLLDTLGRVYDKLGLLERAEPLLRQALARRRETLGSRHPDVALSLAHLADHLQVRGDLGEAEALYREALDLNRAVHGPHHPEVARALNSLADVLHDAGDYAAAEPLYRRALTLRRKLFAKPHADLAASLNDLGVLYHDQGDYPRAEPLYREALALREALLGPDHPDVAVSLNNLATLLRADGRYTDAEPLLRRSVAIHRRALGDRHVKVAVSLQNLAMLLYDKGQPEDAERLMRQAMDVHLSLFGPDASDVATNSNDLALILVAQERRAEAEALFQRSIEGYRKSLPADHPYLAHPLLSLGQLLLERGALRSAEPLLAEALQIRRGAFLANHWRIGDAASALGECRARLGGAAEAEPLLLEGHRVLAAALGEDHVRTRKARERVDQWGGERGRSDPLRAEGRSEKTTAPPF
jgi:serine/threonine-protein kinase